MSTKIYEAYRLQPGRDLWKVAWDIRLRTEKNIRRVLTKVYTGLINEAPRSSPLQKSDGTKPNYLDASRFVWGMYRATTQTSQRSLWDLDVSIAIRRAGQRKFLLIPYPGSGLFQHCLAFLRKCDALTDYHYQDSADRPPHISAREWSDRRRTWAPLLDERWRDMLVLEIVSINGWHQIDPAVDLQRKQTRREIRQKEVSST